MVKQNRVRKYWKRGDVRILWSGHLAQKESEKARYAGGFDTQNTGLDWWINLIAMCLLWIVALFLFVPFSNAQEIPPDFEAKPIFAEEFSGSSLDLTRWGYRGLGIRNHCVNTKDSLRVADGVLRITTFSEEKKPGELVNSCGMISTEKSFRERFGYWVASVRFHQVPGMQCAFWIQASTIGKKIGDATHSGVEMDVFEHLAEASPQEYDHALHWDGYGTAHKQSASKRVLASLDDGKFHQFAVAWRPTGYTFYVDSQVTYEVPTTEVPASEIPEYIILSSEVPREYPAQGFGTKDLSQATFDIDYIHVYPYRPAGQSASEAHGGVGVSAR